MKRETISIVGFGRFGKVIHALFIDGFDILVSSSSYKPGDLPGVRFVSLEEAVQGASAIFLTVPINRIGAVAERIRPLLKSGQLVVDVCSVKEYPDGELRRVLGSTGALVWPTHPMFGPDSTREGFEGLNWVSCEENLDPSRIAPYLAYLEEKGLQVVRTTCEGHDRMAAHTQGLTHLIGRFLDELDVIPTPIDTLGYKRLLAVRDQTCNDTWELFCDLQHFNRFSHEIQGRLGEAILKVFSRFLDTTTSRPRPVVGLARGQGLSDGEARTLIARVDADKAPDLAGDRAALKSEPSPTRLLDDLSAGEIDYGLLVLVDPDKGPSLPALEAMGRYPFEVVALMEYPPTPSPERAASARAHAALLRRRRWTPSTSPSTASHEQGSLSTHR